MQATGGIDGTAASSGGAPQSTGGAGGFGGASGESGGAAATGGMMATGGAPNTSPYCDNSNSLRVISIAAGAEHTCALMSNSGVRCWGANSTGQLGNGTTIDYSAFPTSDALTGVQAIAAGDGHTCALMETGSVRCWGDNTYGQLGDGTTVSQSTPPTNGVLATSGTTQLTGVRSIAAGGRCTCALMETGDVLCWGDVVEQGAIVLSGVKSIAVGENHVCAVMNTGGVRCWGSNEYGQLGDGSTTSHSTPLARDVLTNVRSIAAGSYHTCALMETGGVRCWGGNLLGELGEASTETCNYWDCRTTPPATDVLAGVQAISAGNDWTCALMKTGGVRCWGISAGQLGDGDGTHRTQPPASDALAGIQALTTGGIHACALMQTGGVRCWGYNDHGEIGNGTGDVTADAIARLKPPTSDSFTGIAAITLGGDYPCALMQTGAVRCGPYLPLSTDVVTGARGITGLNGDNCVLMQTGGVRCWGRENRAGQLGDGTTLKRMTLPTSDVLTGAQAIAAGNFHVCALMQETGGIRCWGDNVYGQLGDGESTNAICNMWTPPQPCRPTPPTSNVLTGAQAVSAGGWHTCALMQTGGVRCWGDGYFGALGDGTLTSKSTPPEADALTGVKSLTAGDSHTCALMQTGGMRCWGDNSYGQLGDGTTTSCHTDGDERPCRSTPATNDVITGVEAVSAGAYNTCVVTEAGGVRCWGDNEYGQLGDGTTTSRSTPPADDVLTGARDIAVGWGQVCALMETGGVRCWPRPAIEFTAAQVPGTCE
jgi:alpha-tubulin suppressor-like RCC1 family protein